MTRGGERGRLPSPRVRPETPTGCAQVGPGGGHVLQGVPGPWDRHVRVGCAAVADRLAVLRCPGTSSALAQGLSPNSARIRPLVAVGSGWQLAVGRRWRLAAVGGWRLVAVGG